MGEFSAAREGQSTAQTPSYLHLHHVCYFAFYQSQSYGWDYRQGGRRLFCGINKVRYDSLGAIRTTMQGICRGRRHQKCAEMGSRSCCFTPHPQIFDFVNYALCLFFKNKPSLPPQKGQNYVNEPMSCRKALEGTVLFGITTLRKSSVRSITPSLCNRRLVSPKCSL